MSYIAEMNLIAHALIIGKHTDHSVSSKYFQDIYLKQIWEKVRDIEKPNVLNIGKEFGDEFVGDIIKNFQCSYLISDCCKDIAADYSKMSFLKHLDMVKLMVEQGVSEDDAIEKLIEYDRPQEAGKGPEKIDSLMIEAYEEIKAISQGEKESRLYIPTGYTAYDEAFFGFERGALTIVAARPSMGKTAWVTGTALHMARAGFCVLIISLEMNKMSLTYRVMSFESKLDLQLLRRGKVQSGEAWRKLAEAGQRIAEADLWIDDEPSATASRIRAKIRKFSRKHDIDACIIDYVGLINGDDENKARHEQVSAISRSLVGMSKSLDVAMVTLCQLGRDVEKRADKRPMNSDLRESGALEQDADVIIFLYRDEYYNKRPDNEGIAEITVSKNRNGPINTVNMLFDKEYARFSSKSSEHNWK